MRTGAELVAWLQGRDRADVRGVGREAPNPMERVGEPKVTQMSGRCWRGATWPRC
jgi:hypothetical protein